MVHLVIHFVWKKWLEVIIYIVSRPTVNGLVGWIGAWMGKMERLGSRRSEEENRGEGGAVERGRRRIFVYSVP